MLEKNSMILLSTPDTNISDQMEEKSSSNLKSTIDPRSGFCSKSKIFHSLRPKIKIPPESENLQVTSYAFSLLPSPLPDHNAFVNAPTGAALSYPTLRSQIHSLASALRSYFSSVVNVSKGDVAFVLSPARLEVPVLYFSLLSVGVVVCPSNPICTGKEISYQLSLSKPKLAFATSATVHLLPPHLHVVLIDSPLFQSFLVDYGGYFTRNAIADGEIRQSDTAVILFSSGTSGKVKAAAATHRNYIAMIAGFHHHNDRGIGGNVRNTVILMAPMFHSLGFFLTLKGVAVGDTTVMMGRATLDDMLRVVETYKCTKIVVAPPVIVVMSRSETARSYNLSTLNSIFTGGAPVLESVAREFKYRFPHIVIEQAYGSTEGGGNARMMTEGESLILKSVGRLNHNTQAKIVDPNTNEVMSVGQLGELQLMSPTIMKGYVGNDEATTSTLVNDGWLRTGDLCYFDDEGYLFIVDRLKELIKYKAYQVPPAELEQILLSHPDIVDAAVIPILLNNSYPHKEAGEVPMAFIVRQSGSTINESDVMGFIAKQVAPYKKIRKVAFVESIPKTPSGKILRRDLVVRATSLHVSKL